MKEFLIKIGAEDEKFVVLGELKNFKYYIADRDGDEEIGEPLVICENKNKHTFEVLIDPFKVIKLFEE